MTPIFRSAFSELTALTKLLSADRSKVEHIEVSRKEFDELTSAYGLRPVCSEMLVNGFTVKVRPDPL